MFAVKSHTHLPIPLQLSESVSRPCDAMKRTLGTSITNYFLLKRAKNADEDDNNRQCIYYDCGHKHKQALPCRILSVMPKLGSDIVLPLTLKVKHSDKMEKDTLWKYS